MKPRWRVLPAERRNAPKGPDKDGIVNCRILEIEEHRKLSYTWVVGDMDTGVTDLLARLP